MFVPQNEQGVIVLFTMMAKETGWEIVEIGTAFPDAILRKDGEEWAVEFEFLSSNFLDHRHDHRRCDMIICWQNDYPECPFPVIELCDSESILGDHKKCDPRDKEIEYWKKRAQRAEDRIEQVFRETVQASDDLNQAPSERKRLYLADLLSSGEKVNRTALAQQLGVGRTTLYTWIAELQGSTAITPE